ncbi:MAG TPA: hypothetical protein VM577_00845 [Anaerovoracaceae bacterium]|nr:hypothetical protein [Anaerovoracaceae bacterium]
MNKSTKIQYSKIGVISIAHMMNDLYSNYLPQMLPFLVVLYDGFTVTRATIVVSAFSITSSFTQPLFGYFMDPAGKALAGLYWHPFFLFLLLSGILGSR